MDRQFDDIEEAIKILHEEQNSMGFAISKRSSKRNSIGGSYRYLLFQCAQSGIRRRDADQQGIYLPSSIKSNCLFRAIINFNKLIQKFVLITTDSIHNHEPPNEATGIPGLRRQSRNNFGEDRLTQLVEARSKSGQLTAKNMAAQLCEEYKDQHLNILDSDIYYIQKKLRQGNYSAFHSTTAFLDLLQHSDNIAHYAVFRTDLGKISRLFWTYKDCIDDWKRNPELLMMDNTYKVNRFGLPLLQVTGVTALHTNYSVAFGLASNEDIESFTWLMQQMKATIEIYNIAEPQVIITDFDKALKNGIRTVFKNTQQQICMWHISKNVILYIRKHWKETNGMPGLTQLLGAGTED